MASRTPSPSGQRRYDVVKTLLKFVVPLAGATGGGVALNVLGLLPDSLSDLRSQWPMVVVGVASAIAPAVKNWLQHR